MMLLQAMKHDPVQVMKISSLRSRSWAYSSSSSDGNQAFDENKGSGVEVKVIPMLTEIIINATQNQNVLCKQGRRELAARVQKSATVIQASWKICCSENLLWCPEF